MPEDIIELFALRRKDDGGKPMIALVKFVKNAHCSGEWDAAAFFGVEQAKRARAFHAGIPLYRPTLLRRLDGLAGKLGINALYVKDESARFGLNAFKGLGGIYCLGIKRGAKRFLTLSH